MGEAVLKSIGAGCRIYQGVAMSYPQNIVLGDNVHIMPGCVLNGRGGITIGDNTHIAWDTIIYSYSHNYEGTALPYDDTAIEGPVVIGRNVWICRRVEIRPGITIGEGAVVQMGSTVVTDVPALAVVGPVPLHIIKYRDEERYERLDSQGFYGGANGVKIPGIVRVEV